MSSTARAGLVLFAVLSLGDLADLFLTDGSHPPYSVAITGAVLGAVCLALLPFAWRGGRAAAVALSVLRTVSALTALPAFFMSGVPLAPVVLAAVTLALTATGVVLVAGSFRVPAVSAATR